MKNQTNEQGRGSNADKGQSQVPTPNTERQPTAKPGDNRSPDREGIEAPRHETGNRDSSRNQPGTNPPSRPAPRLDDRPEPRREDDSSGVREPGGALPNRGTPSYGDTEPSDPRQLDVDAGTGGRTVSGDRSNRS